MSQSEDDFVSAAENGAAGDESDLQPDSGRMIHSAIQAEADDLSETSFQNEDVVFVMEVTQRGGLCDYIRIRRGDDPEELAREFVRTHKLSEKYVKRMAESLRSFYHESMRRHIHSARFEADSISSKQSSRTVGSLASKSLRSLTSRGSTVDRTDPVSRIVTHPELRGMDSDSYASGSVHYPQEQMSSRDSFDTQPGARLISSSVHNNALLTPFSNGSTIPIAEDMFRRSQNEDMPFFIPSPMSPPVAPQHHFRRISTDTSQPDEQDSDDDYDEVVDVICDYDDSEDASKAAFARAKATSSARDYSVGYLSDPEILSGRAGGNNRRRAFRRKKISKHHAALYNDLHRDAEVRQLRLDRLRKRSETDLQKQLAQWRMAESSKQWLRDQPSFASNSDTADRLYNEHRLKWERHQEYARAREQEQIPSWSCPKCGKENLGSNESCMTVVGVKRPMMDQRGSSWVYSRKLDENNAIYCGQPRPEAFRPTLLLVDDAPPQRFALDVFSDLYSKRENREHAVARFKEVESMNNPQLFQPTMNRRSESIVKRRRQLSRNNSAATNLTHEIADVNTNDQHTSTRSLGRPSSAPAQGRQRALHFVTRDFDAQLHEVLYKDASDRLVRLQQLREETTVTPPFQPQLTLSKSASAEGGEHDLVFERLHQASLHLKKHREELESYQEPLVNPETGEELFKPRLISKQIPRAVSNIETHLNQEGVRLKQQRSEQEKAVQEEAKKKSSMSHMHTKSLKISDTVRRKAIAEVYQSLLWSAEYKRFMQKGRDKQDQLSEHESLPGDGDDFPMGQILARWQESSLDTELADPGMLPSTKLAALISHMLKQFQPGTITFAQFEDHLCQAISASGLPWSLIFNKSSCIHDRQQESQLEFSFQPSISKESSELAWRLGRGTRKIEEVLLAAGEKYKIKAAQRKEAFEKEQAASLPFKPTLVANNSNIEHRYPNENTAEKFMEQIALLDRTREMLSAHTTNSCARSSIGSGSTIVTKPTATRQLNFGSSTNSLLSYTLSATADPTPSPATDQRPETDVFVPED